MLDKVDKERLFEKLAFEKAPEGSMDAAWLSEGNSCCPGYKVWLKEGRQGPGL